MTSPTLPEFLDALSETFSPTAQIVGATQFRELEEWSSMQALIVIAAIDEHYGVTIPEKQFRGANTFEDLFQLIKELKNGQ